MKTIKIEVLSYLIPVLSIFLTYILGRVSSKNSTAYDVKKLRYEEFYAPYMTKLLAAFDFTDSPSSSSLEARSVFFDLIMGNVYLLGTDSAELVPTFYSSFLQLLEHERYSKEYDEIFLSITKAILLEAEALSKELKYPNLSKTILNIYDV